MANYAADSVLLYMIGQIRVRLQDRNVHDPRQAMDKALEQIVRSDLFSRFQTVPFQGGTVDHVGWDTDAIGALVDMQNDSECEHSVYVPEDTIALGYMNEDVVNAIVRMLESGRSELAELRTIMNSSAHLLATAACRGLMIHDEATEDDRRKAMARLIREGAETALECLEWTERNPKARNQLHPADLTPALTHADRKVREKALRILAQIAPYSERQDQTQPQQGRRR